MRRVGSRHLKENWSLKNAVIALDKDNMKDGKDNPDYRKLEGFCWSLKLMTKTESECWERTIHALQYTWIENDKYEVRIKEELCLIYVKKVD